MDTPTPDSSGADSFDSFITAHADSIGDVASEVEAAVSDDSAFDDDTFEADDFTVAVVAASAPAAPVADDLPFDTSMLGDLSIPTIVRWDAKDYDPFVTGSGAIKLASSAVAPLVAAARNFKTLEAAGLKQFRLEEAIRGNSKQANRLSTALKAGDVLRMPWYSIDAIVEADKVGAQAAHTAMQFRPGVPEKDANGRERKYEFVTGSETPIGLHPSTPSSWIKSAPTVMIAEGMLKADAAFSAMLLNAGISQDELRAPALSSNLDPRAVLTALMDRVPEANRVLILAIAGVYNWRSNNDWLSASFRNRTCWIAFDGDTATNFDVWKQADELRTYLAEKRKMTVLFLSPSAVSDDAGTIAKMGVDDYLAEVGTWATLIKQASVSLPEQPKRKNEDRVGSWRVSSAGTSVEECMPDMDSNGNRVGSVWREQCDIGGRIISIDQYRHASTEEQRTGQFGAGVDTEDVEILVEIELAWEKDGAPVKHTVKGPEAILNYFPEQWLRHGANIPWDVLAHPSWPPKKGQDWLSAIKGHRVDERLERVVWKSAGWVPTPNGLPVFIVGKQVIGGDGLSESALSGINETTLAGSTKFGFTEDPRDDFEDPDFCSTVKGDIEDVMEKFVDSKAWTDTAHSAIVLASAMRPALPLRPKATIYFVGPKGKGKSFTAQAIMSFWSPDGTWWNSLPGSATDTMNSTEYAVSRTPLWVVDDLAPSPDRRSMEKETKALEDIIRSQFNGSSKRRMGPNGTTREKSEPKALLIATAENEPMTGSIRDRVISVNIRTGSLHPSRGVTDELTRFSKETGVPSRLTAALVKYVRYRAELNPDKWKGEVATIADMRKEESLNASNALKKMYRMSDSTTRAGDLVGDLSVALQYLALMAEEVGVDPKVAARIQSAATGNDGLVAGIVNTVAEGNQSKKDSAPGKAVAIALAAMLRSGKVHVVAAEDSSRPPITGSEGNFLNVSLGWEHAGDQMRPKGVKIGYVVEHKKTKAKYIMLDADTAFNEAQRAHPDLILFGQTKTAAWSGMWDEGICVDDAHVGWAREHRNKRPVNTVQFRAGESRPRGIPIEMHTLLNEGTPLPIDPEDQD